MTLIKGALVAFTPTYLTPVPNVTVFQFNPESLTHTWSQPERSGNSGIEAGDANAVPGYPGEEFSLTLYLDANEDIADDVPVSAQLAEVSGVYSRLAALEMLLYPVPSDVTSKLLGQTAAAVANAATATGPGVTPTVPRSTTPFVLLVWGPARVVPVRVTELTIVEKLYDEYLSPVQAEVQLRLNVLTPSELQASGTGNAVLTKLATYAYQYTLHLREAGAVANLGNAGAAVAGIF